MRFKIYRFLTKLLSKYRKFVYNPCDKFVCEFSDKKFCINDCKNCPYNKCSACLKQYDECRRFN